MSLEELSALVRIEPGQLTEWSQLGLVHPADRGRFGDEEPWFCSESCLRT